MNRGHLEFALDGLPPAATRRMIDELLGPDPALAELKEPLHRYSGGNPLFIEEYLRSMVDSGELVGSTRPLPHRRAARRRRGSADRARRPRRPHRPSGDGGQARAAGALGDRRDRDGGSARTGRRRAGRRAAPVAAPPREGRPRGRARGRRAPRVRIQAFPHPGRDLRHAAAPAAQRAAPQRPAGARAAPARATCSRATRCWARPGRRRSPICGRPGGSRPHHLAGAEAIGHFERALGVLQRLPASRSSLETAFDLHCDLRNALVPLGPHQRLLDVMHEAQRLADRAGRRAPPGAGPVVPQQLLRQRGAVGAGARGERAGADPRRARRRDARAGHEQHEPGRDLPHARRLSRRRTGTCTA